MGALKICFWAQVALLRGNMGLKSPIFKPSFQRFGFELNFGGAKTSKIGFSSRREHNFRCRKRPPNWFHFGAHLEVSCDSENCALA